MDDRPIHLSDFAGKVVVINIWGVLVRTVSHRNF